MSTTGDTPPVAGIVLAGGRSRRMGGGDKALMPLAGRPMLAWILARAAPQVAALAINANGDPAPYTGFGCPVIADSVTGFAGPLAGILAGLDWAAVSLPQATHVATFPCDTPFLPEDLVARLASSVDAKGADLACATSDGRDHPVVGLWPIHLRADLRDALTKDGVRKVDRWTARHRLVRVGFEATGREPGIDPFFNANRPEELAIAEARLKDRRSRAVGNAVR